MTLQRTTNRRTVLKTIGAGVVGGTVLTGSATAEEDGHGNANGIGSFLNENPLFKEMPIWDSGITDKTGQSEVEVDVGTMTSINIPEKIWEEDFGGDPPEEGPFAYTPHAVKVSPETTIRWTWTGNSFAARPDEAWPHDVHSLDELFHSPHQGTGTFEYEFEETGTYLYYCTPHGNPGPEYPNLFGMRGAVIVEDE